MQKALLVLVCCLATVLPSAARSSTIVALPERDLVARSDAIVFGTVLATRTYVTAEGRARTRADLQVHKALRGARDGDILVLETPGGKVQPGLVARVDGAPTFEVGKHVFAFLEIHGDAFHPLGLSYGLLDVIRDRTGAYRASRNLRGLSFISPRGTSVPKGDVQLIDEPLEALMQRIAGYLAALPASGEPEGTRR